MGAGRLEILWSFLGNLGGAAVFVGGAYWFLYGRDKPEGDTRGGDGSWAAAERGTGAGTGRAQPPVAGRT